jgi:UDP-N-acetylmuramate--alanine ligase
VLVLFQPHRYTRTAFLMAEFAASFANSDHLYLMDIYAASEAPIAGVDAEELAVKTRAAGHKSVEYVGSMERGIEAIARAAAEGDLVLTLGAGNVSQAGDRILQALRERR